MIPLSFRQWSGSRDTGMNRDTAVREVSEWLYTDSFRAGSYIGDIGAEQNGEEGRPRIPAGVCRRTGAI